MNIRLLTLILLSFLGTSTSAQFSLENLKVNYEETPLGIDNVLHQFSWQMKSESNLRGLAQTAYQIIVHDENNQQVWDSKKVTSSLSHGIFYAGQKLMPTTRYAWELRVWDNQGKVNKKSSWFETGLMNPNIVAWEGAQWIGGGNEEMVFYSHYLSVYKLGFAVQLDKESKSTRASFIFGANDSRLSNQYLNLMGVEKGHNESYIALELDISGLNEGGSGNALLNIYRVGYDLADNPNIPLKTVSIPKEIINSSNKYEKHYLFAHSNFGVFEFFINGEGEAHRLRDASMEPVSPYAPGGLSLNPIGSGNNFISFPNVGRYWF